MAKQERNADSPDTRTGRDGLSVHLPWLIVAVLGLFFLILLPRARQESLTATGRRLAPALGGNGDGGAATDADDAPRPQGGYQAPFRARSAEINALREILLGRKYRQNQEIEAEVLKRSPFEGYYTGDLQLNRGAEDGVRVGMVVANRERVAVGRIVALGKVTSTLRLVTHPDLSMSVYVPSRSLSAITKADASLVETGELGLLAPPPALFVSAIQADEMRGSKRAEHKRDPQFLQPGDQVVTMGASDPANYAHGVVVGTVSHLASVKKSSAGWPLSARVVPGRLDSLRYLRIIVPPALPALPPTQH
ncbi:MAG: hypothetical protein HN849_18890 [Victivallales bacterium]|nr:hypothetical protein [Victivallales bacterium]